MKARSGRPRGAVTIADVAAKAGVSRAPVSRVMNGRSTVAADIAERVIDAAEKLSYRLSNIARSLSLGRTNSIALMVPDLGNPMFQQILRGVMAAAAPFGYRVLVADAAETPTNGFSILVISSTVGRPLTGCNRSSHPSWRPTPYTLNEIPSAVIAFNDLVAFGLLSRLNETGVAVPDDISIVDCDDIELARYATPSLTTLAVPQSELGRHAWQRLQDVITGTTTTHFSRRTAESPTYSCPTTHGCCAGPATCAPNMATSQSLAPERPDAREPATAASFGAFLRQRARPSCLQVAKARRQPTGPAHPGSLLSSVVRRARPRCCSESPPPPGRSDP